MKQCLILQGPSGCGKSTFAATVPKATICSADEFFMKDGEYDFQPDRIQEAHDFCLKKFLDALSNNEQTIVVDNTNIRVYEWAPYYRLAQVHGYNVSIIRFTTSPTICARRGKAPVDVIYTMARSIEPIPPFCVVWYIDGLTGAGAGINSQLGILSDGD